MRSGFRSFPRRDLRGRPWDRAASCVQSARYHERVALTRANQYIAELGAKTGKGSAHPINRQRDVNRHMDGARTCWMHAIRNLLEAFA